jgi:hypothetical protein
MTLLYKIKSNGAPKNSPTLVELDYKIIISKNI